MSTTTQALVALALAAATLTGCDPGPATEAAGSSAAASSTVQVAGGTLPPFGLAVDAARYAAAMKRDTPYIYGIPDGPQSACWTGLVIPNGSAAGTWILNHSGAATVAGVDADKRLLQYGCVFTRPPVDAESGDSGGYGTPSEIRNPEAEAEAAKAGKPYVRAPVWLISLTVLR